MSSPRETLLHILAMDPNFTLDQTATNRILYSYNRSVMELLVVLEELAVPFEIRGRLVGLWATHHDPDVRLGFPRFVHQFAKYINIHSPPTPVPVAHCRINTPSPAAAASPASSVASSTFVESVPSLRDEVGASGANDRLGLTAALIWVLTGEYPTTATGDDTGSDTGALVICTPLGSVLGQPKDQEDSQDGEEEHDAQEDEETETETEDEDEE
ncbi:hypothetical protein B0H13DRAFT_2334193 [Mycena leptocephala]|nr:hypothetical protein B0H13DRAFT_2334193 [Mycena leptocephala]